MSITPRHILSDDNESVKAKSSDRSRRRRKISRSYRYHVVGRVKFFYFRVQSHLEISIPQMRAMERMQLEYEHNVQGRLRGGSNTTDVLRVLRLSVQVHTDYSV